MGVDALIRSLVERYAYESGRLPRVGDRAQQVAGMAAFLCYAVEKAYGWSPEEAAEWIGEAVADISAYGG